MPRSERTVARVIVRSGVLVAAILLLVLFILPAALGAAGPAAVGG